MRRPVVLVLAGLVVVGVTIAIRRAGTTPTDPNAADARPVADRERALPPPGLAAPPSIPRASRSPLEPDAGEAPEPPSIPRRMVRARLVAVEAATNAPIDPHAPFRWTLGEGCEEQDTERRVGSVDQDVMALLPVGADATEITVIIDGWGYRSFRRSFPLRARDDGGFEELRVPLRPVEAGAWKSARIVLEGEGETVADAEVLALALMPAGDWYGKPRLQIEFEAGAPRERVVRVPFAADDLQVGAASRTIAIGGRRVWIGPPTVEIKPVAGDGARLPTYAVARLPAAILELDLRYPPGDRPDVLQFYGSLNRREPETGVQRRLVGTTFYVKVEGSPDVVRVELRRRSWLSALEGTAAGFAVSVDPPPPYEFHLGETARAVVEFRRKSETPPK